MFSTNDLFIGRQFWGKNASSITTVARGRTNPYLFNVVKSKADSRWCEEDAKSPVEETKKEDAENNFQLEIRLVKLGYVGITIH